MPRQTRKKGEFSTYHIILRGNERKNLFLCHEDKSRFLDTLCRMKQKYNFLIYAYCLMDNHVHLLINDNGNDISLILKSINISYAYYFNRMYQRCGHLFQDRFKSELIDNDAYLLQVSRYIHNNPVKAGLAKHPADYLWSSYRIITCKDKDLNELISKEKILLCISPNLLNAVKGYIDYVNREDSKDISFMEIQEDFGRDMKNTHFIRSMEQAKNKITHHLSQKGLTFEVAMLNVELRNELLRKLRKNSSLTLKQLGELFGGLSESRVSRILNK